MGTSTNGIMAYGYDFGAEESLLLREAQKGPGNEYGYFKTSWWDDEHETGTEDDDEEEAPGLFERMTKRLYESIPDGDYAMYILATADFQAYRGDTKAIDLDRLRDDPAAGDWDAKLAEALRILEVHPLQQASTWLLASYWG